jgi:hypothetical protein
MNAPQELISNFDTYKKIIKRLSKYSGNTVKSKSKNYSYLNYGIFATKNFKYYFYVIDDAIEGIFIIKCDGTAVFKDQEEERKFFVHPTSEEHERWMEELVKAELTLDLELREADELERKLTAIAAKIAKSLI